MIARMYSQQLKICYAISNKLAAAKIKKLSTKVKQKQSVGDVHNLQQFLTTQITEGKLQSTIERTSKYDDGFAEFMKQYKQKHQNVLDLTHYATSPLNKSTTLREQEYLELKRFLEQRRKQLKSQFSELNNKVEDDEDEEVEVEETEEEAALGESGGELQIPEMTNRTGFQIDDSFFTILIDRDTNTQVTTLQRINSFRQLIFMGNANGIIGYGQGKGKDFEQALRNAVKDAKRNLVPLSLDLWLTCPVKLEGKFNDATIEINPRPLGFNAYGNPQIASMLMLTGIHHCSYKVRSRNQVPYSLLYAFMQAVTSNTTAEEISEAFGTKIYRQNWGKKIGRVAPLTFEGI